MDDGGRTVCEFCEDFAAFGFKFCPYGQDGKFGPVPTGFGDGLGEGHVLADHVDLGAIGFFDSVYFDPEERKKNFVGPIVLVEGSRPSGGEQTSARFHPFCDFGGCGPGDVLVGQIEDLVLGEGAVEGIGLH